MSNFTIGISLLILAIVIFYAFVAVLEGIEVMIWVMLIGLGILIPILLGVYFLVQP